MSELLRLYAPEECGKDGYPAAWHRCPGCSGRGGGYNGEDGTEWECQSCLGAGSIKALIRQLAGQRCERCQHPYEKGGGEWTPCDEDCTHDGPLRLVADSDGDELTVSDLVVERLADTLPGFASAGELAATGDRVVAGWRILTVHHLTGEKADCRWWNLAALCQRCHLQIQGRVVMGQLWPHEHSPWFKPHAAGYYALVYLGEELSREQAFERQEELLALERAA